MLCWFSLYNPVGNNPNNKLSRQVFPTQNLFRLLPINRHSRKIYNLSGRTGCYQNSAWVPHYQHGNTAATRAGRGPVNRFLVVVNGLVTVYLYLNKKIESVECCLLKTVSVK